MYTQKNMNNLLLPEYYFAILSWEPEVAFLDYDKRSRIDQSGISFNLASLRTNSWIRLSGPTQSSDYNLLCAFPHDQVQSLLCPKCPISPSFLSSSYQNYLLWNLVQSRGFVKEDWTGTVASPSTSSKQLIPVLSLYFLVSRCHLFYSHSFHVSRCSLNGNSLPIIFC